MKKVSRADALDAVRIILYYIGEDPERPGLKGTPDRFLRAWEDHWGVGYNPNHVARQVDSIDHGRFIGEGQFDEMVLVRQLKFFSHCEHHLAPFFGTVDVAYLPAESSILGLSKFARIVSLAARKLQVQERMTEEIADQLTIFTKSENVAVHVKAQHLCMMSRGVEQPVSDTVTSALRGVFLTKHEARAEFMRLVSNGH